MKNTFASLIGYFCNLQNENFFICGLLILVNASALEFVPAILAKPLVLRSFEMKTRLRKFCIENGTTIARFDCVMNLLDLLIIYLACGAPFGVYYFFKNRARKNTSWLWLKIILHFLFWIPFSLQLLYRNENLKLPFFNSEKTLSPNFNQEKNLCLIQKRIEKVLLESNLKISIYEFRETIERYIGLTLANGMKAGDTTLAEAEIFRISLTNNSKLGSICLERRNRRRLSFHHSEARKDFLCLIEQLSKFNSNDFLQKTLELSAIELAESLNDDEAQIELENMFTRRAQTSSQPDVRKPEKDLWKPEIHKPLPLKQTSYPFQPLNTTMNLREKD